MNKFNINIASVPDRDKLVAEIWYGETLIAEINQESEDPAIEIYALGNLNFELTEFQAMVEKAKRSLLQVSHQGKLGQLLEKNKLVLVKDYLSALQGNKTALRTEIIHLMDDYGVLLITLMTELGYVGNNGFWFEQAAYFLSFSLTHLEGAEQAALYLFQKALSVKPGDVGLMKAVLDFYFPPIVLLSAEDALDIASRILKVDPEYAKAIQIVHER